jgi:predicted nucleic acid-binding protein
MAFVIRLYDVAYIAVASRLRATLVTLYGRLKRSPEAGIARIVGPAELV